MTRALTTVTTGAAAFYAFSVLPLAQTYAIFFAMPLLITVLSIPMLGEHVGIRRGLAVLVGLIGVMIVLRPGQAEMQLGHLVGLCAAFSGALNSVIVRKIGTAERSAVLMLYPMIATVILMGAILPFVYRPMPVEHLALAGVITAQFMGLPGMVLFIAITLAWWREVRLKGTFEHIGPHNAMHIATVGTVLAALFTGFIDHYFSFTQVLIALFWLVLVGASRAAARVCRRRSTQVRVPSPRRRRARGQGFAAGHRLRHGRRGQLDDRPAAGRRRAR